MVAIACLMLLLAVDSLAGDIIPGGARTDIYGPMLSGKRVGLLSNHTGVLPDGRHTLDFMLDCGVDVAVIFSPEHGFRGTADAGEHVGSSVDKATGLPVVSLYSGRKWPLDSVRMASVDAIVVDLQDVGARFYTYHITMIHAMESAARWGVPVYVFDRPNPLGMVVDGPVLDMNLRSGVGRLPIPVIHGMTMGELAAAANGEGWLDAGLRADLTVIPCAGYTHDSCYELPVAPSPNLRTPLAVALYPSLCPFEGTPVSVGRGTEFPFEIYGHPSMKGNHTYSFVPVGRVGAKNPPHKGVRCYGTDLRGVECDSVLKHGFDLTYLADAYRSMPRTSKTGFFTSFFDKLVGNRAVRLQLSRGESIEKIRKTWSAEVIAFRDLRRRYLIYPEETKAYPQITTDL